MIGSLIRHTLAAGIMFCAATFLVQAAGLAYLWTTGRLNRDKAHRMLALAYDVDLESIEARYDPAQKPVESEQVALEAVIEKRLEKSLDLELRETAFDKALLDLRALESELSAQQARFDLRLKEWETSINNLRQETLDEGMANLQLKLEAIQPAQAKDLIMKMIAEPADENDHSLDAAVTILKNMAVEKSRKIIAEFKTPEEVDQLHEILTRIRLGKPGADVLSEAQKDLEQFRGR